MLLILFCISCLVIVLLSPYDSNKNDCVFIVAGTTVFFVLIILSNYIGVNQQIKQNRIKNEAIITEAQAVGTDNEDMSKAQVIKITKKWNEDVLSKKHLASDPWTNWFYNEKVVNAMDYIEIPEWDIESPDGGGNE